MSRSAKLQVKCCILLQVHPAALPAPLGVLAISQVADEKIIGFLFFGSLFPFNQVVLICFLTGRHELLQELRSRNLLLDRW